MAKNTAPKRGASRTPPPPSKREIPNWLWMACGLAVGGFAMFLTRLEPGSDAVKRSTGEPPAKTTVQAPQPDKPKYDFYTLLPESKVVVPPTAQQQPSPAKPPLQPPVPPVQPSLPPPLQPQLAKPVQPTAPTQPIVQLQPNKPAQPVVVPVQPAKPPQPAQPAQSTAQTPPAKPAQPTVQAQPAKPAQSTVQAPPAKPAQPTAQAQPAKPAQQTAQTPPPTPAQDAARAEALLNGRTPPTVTAAAAVAAKPPAPPKPAPTTYYLQAGAFRNKADADDARARIALLGQSARVEVGTVRGETWHRVVAGPFSSRQQMEAAQKQLAGDGFSNLLTQQR